MGRKGRQKPRSTKAIARDKFPISGLAQRRKLLKEEFISQSEVYKAERSKLKKLKEKVKKIQIDVETLTARYTVTDSAKKRKLLKRKRHPTRLTETNSEEYAVPSAKRSRQRRKKETLDACGDIHGGSTEDKGSTLDGIWLSLIKESTPTRLANYLNKSKKIKTHVLPKVVKENISTFETSLENKVRSIKVLYSNGLMSKEKYKSVRQILSTSYCNKSKKRTGLQFMHNTPVPKILPYGKLIEFVNSVDMGNVKDFKADFCYDLGDDDQVKGAYRDVEDFLLELADMYVYTDKLEPFLLHFESEPYHFRVAIGADGAPFGKDDEATAWLLSFLNVGGRIASYNESFIIAGGNCGESHPSMFRYARKLVSDIAYIETQSYVLPLTEVQAIFTVDLVPSDMKWASTFSGELSNAAFYFSPFGNVNNDNMCTVNGVLGPSNECTWKPWSYSERLQVATKVTEKRNDLDQTALAQSTKRSKLLSYIRTLKSRQEHAPVLGQLVDNIFAEPLHNSNNAWQQLHVLMLGHSIDKSNLPSTCNDCSKIPECAFSSHLSSLKDIGATRLYKKVKKWFSQGRKGPLSYRFTGKETKKMCQKFMHIVKAISCESDSPLQKLKVSTFAFIGLQLRDATSRFSRVSIDATVLQEIKDSCRNYFNACSLLLDSVTPTVWTIGCAVPYHTELLYKKFGLGLGINTMQGREAKHIRISQYAKHATLTTRWQLVFRHDYVTTVWMRKQDPFSFTYHKNRELYEPKEINEPGFCYCGLEKEPFTETCMFCSSDMYQSIKRSADTGQLDPYICNLLSVLS